METKKLDNEVLDNKETLKKIDNLIENEKTKIKKLDVMHKDMIELSKSINRCVDLLSQSIKSQHSEIKYNDMRNINKKIYLNMASFLDDEEEQTRKKINKLYDEKDTILKENKNKEE